MSERDMRVCIWPILKIANREYVEPKYFNWEKIKKLKNLLGAYKWSFSKKSFRMFENTMISRESGKA